MAPLCANKHFSICIQREFSRILKWNFSLCHKFFFVSPEIRNGCGSSLFVLHTLARVDLSPLRFPPCSSKAAFVALFTLS